MTYSVQITNQDAGAACTNPLSITLARGDSNAAFTSSIPTPVSLAPGASTTVTLTVTEVSATSGATTTTTVTASAAAHTNGTNNIVTTFNTSNPLVHNSVSTSSSKWAGSWGVAGGRYGAITCETCHIDSTTNIKKIKSTVITSPNTPTNRFPAEIGGVAPSFTRVSGTPGTVGVMGDDSTNPRASSSKICEICHTYDATGANGTKYHAYSGGINNPAHANNAADCIGCHKHSEGFKAPACDTCHGNPPTAATAGGPTGLANSPNTTGSATPGATTQNTLSAVPMHAAIATATRTCR